MKAIPPRHRHVPAWLACLLATFLPSLLPAAEPAAPAQTEAKPQTDTPPAATAPGFVRVTRDKEDRPLAMETVIASYVPAGDDGPKGLVVDLIGAVHVGERDYYKALNKRFADYDVVLYELVAPEGTRIPKGGGRKPGAGNPVSSLQGGMQTLLELEFQLEQIDYTRKNLVHADMSPEEFAKSLNEREDGMLGMFFRMLGYSMAQQTKEAGNSTDAQLLMAFFAKDRAMRLKRIMANQFENIEAQMGMFEGPKGSTLITERNKKALAVLTRQIDGGKRRIGIFYGAGHLPDMERRLIDEFGLRRQGESWLTAWKLQ